MIQISWTALIGLALAILLLPLKWILCALLAAVIHESCHILALMLLGSKVFGICIGVGGTVIDCWIPDQKREIVSILAGPAGSFLLLSFQDILPELSVCAAIQGLFNLIPIYPLDGGRILKILLGKYSGKLFAIFQILGVILISSVFAVFTYELIGKYTFPFFAAILLSLLRNTPCKEV